MKRILQTTVIKKDKVEQYKKYHAAVWLVVLYLVSWYLLSGSTRPEVEAGLLKYGVKLLTIWQPSDGRFQT
jgi:hypothetical protein